MSDDMYVWTDLETFGLEPDRDPIIEIGFKITDAELRPTASFHTLVWEEAVHDRALQRLNSAANGGNADARFVMEMHTKSSLFDDAMNQGISNEEATHQLLKWLDGQGVKDQPLCGSSVHFDRSFFAAQMPEVLTRFAYRNIDISTLKLLCMRMNPVMYGYLKEDTKPQALHRVLADLDDTIGEAKWYFDNFLYQAPLEH